LSCMLRGVLFIISLKRGRKESAENYINLTCFNCWYIERKEKGCFLGKLFI